MVAFTITPSRAAARLNSGVRPAMNFFASACAFLLVAVLGESAAAEPLKACASGLSPESSVGPKLPRKLHNEFAGTAEISLIILPTGDVLSAKVVSATWKPVGRSRGEPTGYNESIVSALSQWRYPARRVACRHTFPMEFQWSP